MEAKRLLKIAVQIAVVVAIFYFMATSLLDNWSQVAAYSWNFNYFLLALSFLILFAYFPGAIFLWNRALHILGNGLRFRKALKIWCKSRVGSYIPGKVWLVLGRLYLCEKEGISKAKTSISIMMELTLTVVSGIIIFSLSFLFWSDAGLFSQMAPILLIIPVGLASLYPPVYTRVINFMLVRSGRERVTVSVPYVKVLGLVLVYCLMWILYGAAFFVLIMSFTYVSPFAFPGIVGAFALSWVVGFLSFITPSGIGVREGVNAFLLSFFFPVPVAILISFIARLVYMVVEMVYMAMSIKI